jgi:hypothetical protein
LRVRGLKFFGRFTSASVRWAWSTTLRQHRGSPWFGAAERR